MLNYQKTNKQISFWSLLKNELYSIYRLNLFRKANTNKTSKTWRYIIYITIILALTVIPTCAAYFFLAKMGYGALIPTLVITLTISLCFILLFMRTFDSIFDKKIFEMNATLPISPIRLVLAKSTASMFSVIILMLLVNVGPIIIYSSYHLSAYEIGTLGLTVESSWSTTVMLLLLPFVSSSLLFSISFFLSLLINFLGSLTYHRKTVISLCNGIVIAFFFCCVNLSIQATNIPFLRDYYILYSKFINNICFNWIYFLITTAISLIFFLIFIFTIARNYDALGKRILVEKHKYSNKIVYQNKLRIIPALFKNECKRLINNLFWIFNSCLSGITTIIFALLFFTIPALRVIFKIDLAPFYIVGALIIVSCLATPMSSIISIEGKSRWIIGILPVRKSQVIIAKYLIHVIVIVIPVLIASILTGIFAISKDIDTMGAIFIMSYPALMASAFGLWALGINLNIYNFEWTSISHIIKQGAPTILVLCGAIVCGSSLIIIGILTNSVWLLYGFSLALLISVVFFAFVLLKRGNLLFE